MSLARGEGASADESERPAGRSRRRWILVALLLLTVDWSRPGPSQVTGRLLVAGIDLYQATLSRAMPRLGVKCRFEPTCSQYGEAVIRRDGALVGSAKTVARIARCGPWTPTGTADPP